MKQASFPGERHRSTLPHRQAYPDARSEVRQQPPTTEFCAAPPDGGPVSNPETQPWRISPEVELLLQVAQAKQDPGGVERLRALTASALDWDEVVVLAREHALGSLLYHNLQTSCPELVPSRRMEQLRRHYLISCARVLRRAALLHTLVGALAGSSIKALAIKGPALAQTAYGDLTLRQSNDLDLMISKQDLFPALKVLEDLGFEQFEDHCRQDLQLLLGTQHCHNLMLVSPWGGDLVELHWAFLPGYLGLAIDLLALPRHNIELEGQPLEVLTDEAQLLILAVHGTKHAWRRLGWIADLAHITRRNTDLDWGWIQAAAIRHGCWRMVRLGLALANALCQAAIPSPLLAVAAADRRLQRLKRAVIGTFACEPLLLPGGRFAELLFWLRGLDRWKDQLRVAAFLLFAPNEIDFKRHRRHPARFLRPWRLLITYGFSPLWRRLQGSGRYSSNLSCRRPAERR